MKIPLPHRSLHSGLQGIHTYIGSGKDVLVVGFCTSWRPCVIIDKCMIPLVDIHVRLTSIGYCYILWPSTSKYPEIYNYSN